MADQNPGFDLSNPSTMSQIAAMLATASRGEGGNGITNYTPHFNPTLGPDQTLGLPGMMGSQFGAAGQQAGMLGMQLGWTMFPDLMQRLQSNSNVDMMALGQQRLAHHAQMGYLSTSGTQIADSMNLAQNSPLRGLLASPMAMPLLSSVIPGFNDMIGALTPNQVTQFGGQNMITTAMKMNASGRLEMSQLDALERARKSMTEVDGRRNATFMNGFTQDEFAQIQVYAQDEGYGDITQNKANDRQVARERAIKKRGNYTYDQLSDTDKAAVQVEAEDAVRANNQTVGAGHASGVVRSIMKTFQTDLGTAMQIGQASNLTSHSAEDTAKIQETMRQIEALGKTAQMSGEAMLTMAKVVQARSGGDLLTAQTMVNAAQSANRFTAARLQGTPGHLGEAADETATNTVANWQNSPAEHNRIAFLQTASTADHARYIKLAKSTNKADRDEARGMVDRAVMDPHSHIGQVFYTDNEFAEAQGKALIDLGADATALINNEEIQAEMIRQIKSSSGGPGEADPLAGLVDLDKETSLKVGTGLKGGMTSPELAKYAGITDGQADKFYRGYHSNTSASSAGRTLVDVDSVIASLHQTQQIRDDIAKNRGLEDQAQLEQQNQFGGLVPDLFRGKITNISEAMQSIGKAMSPAMAALVGSFSAPTQSALIAATQGRQTAIQDLASAKTDAQKSDATQRLKNARETIDAITPMAPERSQRAKRALGLAEADDDVQDVDAHGGILGRIYNVDVGRAVDKTKNAKPAAASAAPAAAAATVNGVIHVDIDLKQDGTHVPKTRYGARITQQKSGVSVQSTVNGTPQSTGSAP
jgi:hypothetical protein